MIQIARAGFLAAIGIGLAACATAADPDLTTVNTRSSSIETPEQPLQCVPYARARSGINLYGDAAKWWDLAEGRYARSSIPSIGSVVVLTGYGPRRGHLAVVTAIDSPRQIRIDHANWFSDGRIYRDDPVVDTTPDNDWSAVRVWDARDNVLGSHTYIVRGFIGPDRDSASDQLANRE